jgi:hypothetical protein
MLKSALAAMNEVRHVDGKRSGGGSTTGPKTHTNRFDDENGRCASAHGDSTRTDAPPASWGGGDLDLAKIVSIYGQGLRARFHPVCQKQERRDREIVLLVEGARRSLGHRRTDLLEEIGNAKPVPAAQESRSRKVGGRTAAGEIGKVTAGGAAFRIDHSPRSTRQRRKRSLTPDSR